MKFKRTIATTLAMTTLFSLSAYADTNPRVTLNGNEVAFENAKPTIISERTLVPVRGIFDKMGYEIAFDAKTKTATLTKGSNKIIASSKELTANGKAVGNADVFPQLINEYFMVPLRAVSEATGADVEWDKKTKTVVITSKDVVSEIPEGAENIDQKDPNGTMSVDEGSYLNSVNNTVKSINTTAKNEKCAPILMVLGQAELNADELKDSYTEEDFAWLDKHIETIIAMTPPEDLKKVQTDIESYCTILQKAKLYCISGEIDKQELAGKMSSLKEEKEKLNEQFSVDLYQYFSDNEVFFESVYGEDVLDLLK